METQIDYYKHSALNVSSINTFINKSPLHFWNNSTLNPDYYSSSETPSMIFGRAAHKIFLENNTFYDEFAITPEINKRTKAGKEEYAEFERMNVGKSIIDPQDMVKLTNMQNALNTNSQIKILMHDAECEKEVYWRYDGINCKAKLDIIAKVNGIEVLIDYKTTSSSNIKDFEKSIAQYGYHRQAAWYIDAARILGHDPKAFMFITQEKDLAEAIGIFSIDEESIEIGRQQNAEATQEIKERLSSGKWNAYPEEIQSIALPFWYIKQTQALENYNV